MRRAREGGASVRVAGGGGAKKGPIDPASANPSSRRRLLDHVPFSVSEDLNRLYRLGNHVSCSPRFPGRASGTAGRSLPSRGYDFSGPVGDLPGVEATSCIKPLSLSTWRNLSGIQKVTLPLCLRLRLDVPLRKRRIE